MDTQFYSQEKDRRVWAESGLSSEGSDRCKNFHTSFTRRELVLLHRLNSNKTLKFVQVDVLTTTANEDGEANESYYEFESTLIVVSAS